MVVDTVCVVRSQNTRECRNQDVLFLGTSESNVLPGLSSCSVSKPVSYITREEWSGVMEGVDWKEGGNRGGNTGHRHQMI